MRKGPLAAGVALLIAGTVAIALVISGSKSGGSTSSASSSAAPLVTLTCLGGSEKTALMADPALQAILRSKYHLRVSFEPMGSYQQVELPTARLEAQHIDCLWPSSSSAQRVFESMHRTSDFSGYRAQTVLESPEVIYSGPQSTAALVRAGIVQQRDNRYYIVDMKRLLLDLVLANKTWASLGAAAEGGRPVTIFSTDPATSNSGFTLAQLELIIVSTNDPYSEPTLQQARAHLGIIRNLYNAQGLQADSSDSGFEQWLLQGAEQYAPLYAGYENQIIQKLVQSSGDPSVAQQLRDQVRILYPEPTIYADHPILALDPQAGRFIDAMQDPQIQELAWSKYGFRSGVQFGINNVSDFPQLPLATSVRTTSPPSADVTLALLDCIQANKCN
jgi:hypothetical protein